MIPEYKSEAVNKIKEKSEILRKYSGDEKVEKPLTVKDKIECETCGKIVLPTVNFCESCGTTLSIR